MMLEGLPLRRPALNEFAEQNSASSRDNNSLLSVFFANWRMIGVSVRTTISLLVVRVNTPARRVNKERPMILGLLEDKAILENLLAMNTKHLV